MLNLFYFFRLIIIVTYGSSFVDSVAQCQLIRPPSSGPLHSPLVFKQLNTVLSLLPMLSLLLGQLQLLQLPLTRIKLQAKDRHRQKEFGISRDATQSNQ